MATKERMEKYAAIAARAEEKGLLQDDRLALIMDLEVADEEFNIRLDDLLAAGDFDFAHDIVGIQSNINRREKRMCGYFMPRFAQI